MAPLAAERIPLTARLVWQLLAPRPGRLEFALRLALACALTTVMVELYGTPEAALTVYVSFFLIRPDRATSVIISFVFLVVLSLTLLLLLPFFMLVADDPMWRVFIMALLSLLFTFMASASRLAMIMPIVALISVYALDLLGSVPDGELATRLLLYAWLFVGMPAFAMVVVNLLFGPAPRRLAGHELARRLRAAAALLRAPAERKDFEALLGQGIGEVLGLLKGAGIEKTSMQADLQSLRQAALSTMRIMLLADAASRLPGLCPGPEIAARLVEMADILETGAYPVEIEPVPAAQSPSSPEEAVWRTEMNECLTGFAIPPATQAPAPTPAPRAGIWLADAFTNPRHIRYALKTTGAAMFCYMLYSQLDWPNIHTSLITCYIVALGTTAETVEKLALRILGCLIGGAAGIAAIVFLTPGISSIGALLITIFFAAFASAWVAGGETRIAYAGFQMAFAFFLCVLQEGTPGGGPGFDLTIARDRIIGILLGNIVIYLVFTRLWPVSVTGNIPATLTRLLHKLASMVRAKGEAASLAASEASAELGNLERMLILSAYEPAALRPAPEWLVAYRAGTEDAASLAGALLLGAAQNEAAANRLAAQLDQLATGQDEPREDALDETMRLPALRDFIETRLDDLRRLPRHPDEDPLHAAV
jgi:multidrug resistance protein MdtO